MMTMKWKTICVKVIIPSRGNAELPRGTIAQMYYKVIYIVDEPYLA